MRVSTTMIYDAGLASMQQSRSSQVKLQEQLGSGLRVMTPSDDPVAAATVLDVKQSQALNNQLKTNGDTAKSLLGLEESALADATALLQDAKTLAIYAGNPTLANSDRAAIATELTSRYQELMGIANRGDGNGQFLFSGYQGATLPFAETAPGVVAYAGDAGQRLAQIGITRTIPVSDSGDAVFRAIRNGNGTFATAPGANAGGGTIDSGVVTDPSKWNTPANAKNFTIKFDVNNSVTPAMTTYDIIDNVNNVSLLTGAAPAAAGPYLRTYVPGSTISLATQSPPDTNATPFDFGATVTVSAAPASGDTFTLRASTNQDVFSVLHGLIAALQSGTNATAVSTAAYQNALNAAMSGLDNALNHVLTVRADVGARLKEVDTAQSTSDDLSLQYNRTVSGLQDLDYAKAISDLNQQQVFLQAAQQSFLKITSLNLFDLLR
jgi:flagellar hook-associated protein 3 FlgL